MEITDKERLDFLQAQKITRWVGFHYGENGTELGGRVTWPVFPGMDLRAEIDAAIERSRKYIPSKGWRYK